MWQKYLLILRKHQEQKLLLLTMIYYNFLRLAYLRLQNTGQYSLAIDNARTVRQLRFLRLYTIRTVSHFIIYIL